MAAKPNLGTKRECLSCGARFYDLNKSPIICPKCGATFDPESLQKTKKKVVAAEPSAKPKKPERPSAEEETMVPVEGEDDFVEAEVETDEEEEDEAVIEDTSDFGGEDVDVDVDPALDDEDK